MRKITVTDFTLKATIMSDGRQPSFRDKTNIAKCLESMGVDAVELPAVKNPKEDTVVNRTIAELLKTATAKIPVGMTEESVDEAWNCVSKAQNPCLRVTVPVSTVQMEYLYHIKSSKMLETVEMLTRYAKSKCDNIELFCLDATRADREFLKSVCSAAFSNGANSVTLSDDAGIMMPDEIAEMVADVKSDCKIKVAVAPSNALQLAAANAVAAIKAGADGVETAVTGEFLNPAVLSDIIRQKGADLKSECALNCAGIHREADEVFAIINEGSHGGDVLGDSINSGVKLTAASTMSEVCEVVRSLGYELSHEDSGKVYEEFKRVSAKKNRIGFKEIDAIVASSAMQVPSTYHVESYVINSGNIITATANIVLSRDGEKLNGISVGDGPINAAFLAIEQVIGHHYELDDFQIQSITEGHEAMGSALVKLRDGDKLYSGSGVSTDIIGASIRAYVNALNKIVYNGR